MKEIDDIFAEEMRKEIDREILDTVRMNMLVQKEWIKVTDRMDIGPRTKSKWLQDHIQGWYHLFPEAVLFERTEDAILYKMRWL